MTNCFRVFDESPRPWLDAEALKEKYHRITAQQHPDIAGGSTQFAEINRAYQVLSDPVARLRHLLELEAPEALARKTEAPVEIAEYFTSIAHVRHEADAFFKKHDAAASPVAKALLAGEQYQVQEQLEEMIAKLQQEEEELLAGLRKLDALWDSNRSAALDELPRTWQSLVYIAKWLGMLRESLFRLASM